MNVIYICICMNRCRSWHSLFYLTLSLLVEIEKMLNLMSTEWVDNCDIGVVYMALGDFDSAIEYFEKAIEKHEGIMLLIKYNIRYCPELEQDPRTQKLLEKIGLPLE